MKNKNAILIIVMMLVVVILLISLISRAGNDDIKITDNTQVKKDSNKINENYGNINTDSNKEDSLDDKDNSSENDSSLTEEHSNNLYENNNNYVEDKSINHDNSGIENADNSNNVDNSSNMNKEDFYYTEISDSILNRIKGKSYPASDDCKVSLDELRYCHILHIGFDGETHEGELIVNKAIADDIIDIFQNLYEKKYPIEKMQLVDDFGADDETSMRANNTSAFNYRVVSGSTTLSNHSYGLAIDINPLYNPYVVTKSDGSTDVQPKNAWDYVDRYQTNPYFIRKYDDCYNLFVDHGFTWGGDWNTKKDYQHFEKKAQ